MPGKQEKVPTEKVTFDDAWNGFKTDYLPFVEWVQGQDKDQFIVVNFDENTPIAYTNKWSREQFKIRVIQDENIKMLSAGKRLFVKLKAFCITVNKLPKDLGTVQINRFGSGFETDYSIQVALKQFKLI